MAVVSSIAHFTALHKRVWEGRAGLSRCAPARSTCLLDHPQRVVVLFLAALATALSHAGAVAALPPPQSPGAASTQPRTPGSVTAEEVAGVKQAAESALADEQYQQAVAIR